MLPPCHQIASNALFKGKIGGSRVAAKSCFSFGVNKNTLGIIKNTLGVLSIKARLMLNKAGLFSNKAGLLLNKAGLFSNKAGLHDFSIRGRFLSPQALRGFLFLVENV